MSLGLRQTLVLGTLCVTASVLAPFAVQSASTQRIRSRIPHANSAITMSERVVRVKGNGVVHAGNNQAKISAMIRVASTNTVLEASSAVSSASQELHTRLLQLPRVEPQHLVTENIHIHTEHDYGPNGQRGDPKYVVQQAITVTLQQASGDDVADAIDRMVNAAGNALQLNSVTFGVSPEVQEQLIATARKMAAEDARAKAQLYCDALGVRVGRVLSVAEAGAEQALPFPQPARAKMAMAEGFAGAPVNMGDGAVEATVWVTFELEGGEL